MKIQVGDIVTVKGGGPKMTVEEIQYEGIDAKVVKCTWFDKDNHTVKGIFAPSVLVPVND